MTVSTKSVEGRRTVRYGSYDELLSDAERIASSNSVQTLGNWSPGQIFKHLADAIESSIDGSGFVLPLANPNYFYNADEAQILIRFTASRIQSTKKFQPGPIDTQEALDELRKAVARMKSETNRVMHPAFGNITRRMGPIQLAAL